MSQTSTIEASVRGSATRRRILKTGGAATVLALSGGLRAQGGDWPRRPVRLIVPVAPGGVYDAQARIVAEKLSAILGQQVLVENKPGAESKIGMAAVANADPDGYTILMCGSTMVHAVVFNQDAHLKLSQFTPLGMCSWLPIGFGTNAAIPAESLGEFVRYAKDRPGQLAYGSIALSTRGIGEAFKLAAGIDLIHIGYKGESPLTTDLIAGHVPTGFMTSGGFKQWYGNGGKIRWLAVTTPKRMTRFPDVPTFVESGYPTMDLSAWLGFSAPSKTPKEIVARLSQAIGEAMAAPDVGSRILDLGVEPHYLPADGFAGFMDEELDKWTRLQRETGLEIS
ncbi:MAG: tripartite tricarboxylate transporter substrate binding protein [Burkholderiaceae bacterium]